MAELYMATFTCLGDAGHPSQLGTAAEAQDAELEWK